MQRELEWVVSISSRHPMVPSPPCYGASVSRLGSNVNWCHFPILTAQSITVTWNWRAPSLTMISWQWPQRWKNGPFITSTIILQPFSGNAKALPQPRAHPPIYCVYRHSINANSVMSSNTTIFRGNPMSWRIFYHAHGISLTFKLLLTLIPIFHSPCLGKYATCASPCIRV